MTTRTYIDPEGVMRPRMDRKLLLVDVSVDDMRVGMQYCRQKRIAVQAGGAVGLWPRFLCGQFDWVTTYEPHALNFECLLHNTHGLKNLVAINSALGRRKDLVGMKLDTSELDNGGAFYVDGPGDIAQVALDEQEWPHLDFLCLDVEGRELDVLCGGVKTLKRCKPVIQLESKMLPHMEAWHTKPQDVIEHLKALGFRMVDQVKRDIVFVHTDFL